MIGDRARQDVQFACAIACLKDTTHPPLHRPKCTVHAYVCVCVRVRVRARVCAGVLLGVAALQALFGPRVGRPKLHWLSAVLLVPHCCLKPRPNLALHQVRCMRFAWKGGGGLPRLLLLLLLSITSLCKHSPGCMHSHSTHTAATAAWTPAVKNLSFSS